MARRYTKVSKNVTEKRLFVGINKDNMDSFDKENLLGIKRLFDVMKSEIEEITEIESKITELNGPLSSGKFDELVDILKQYDNVNVNVNKNKLKDSALAKIDEFYVEMKFKIRDVIDTYESIHIKQQNLSKNVKMLIASQYNTSINYTNVDSTEIPAEIDVEILYDTIFNKIKNFPSKYGSIK